MQAINLFFSTLLFISVSLSSGAQSAGLFSFNLFSSTLCEVNHNYNDCAAILYKGKLLVDEYSPRGVCKLEQGMTGTLTVATVTLSDDGGAPVKNIGFKVAIKNDRTNTLWMYADKTLQEVQVEDILKKCEKGDRIIFMTVDQKFSLPHHEIDVSWGC